jgi:hypothetical protein
MACSTSLPSLPRDVCSISREDDAEKSCTSADGRCMDTVAYIVSQAGCAETGTDSGLCELGSVNKQQGKM